MWHLLHFFKKENFLLRIQSLELRNNSKADLKEMRKLIKMRENVYKNADYSRSLKEENSHIESNSLHSFVPN